MTIINNAEQLQDWVGQEIGKSSWLKISQDMITQFAEATGDHQWIHTDVKKASQSVFGGTIAHGFLLLSLLPRLKSELARFDCAQMVINYGCERLRFLNPVKAGAKVRLAAKLDSLENGPSGIKLFIHNKLEIEGETKPALIADTILLLVV